MKLTAKTYGDVVVIRLNGKLDFDGFTRLKIMIQDVRQKGYSNVLLNFSEVTSVLNTFLQQLVSPIRSLNLLGGRVAFCEVSPGIEKMIQNTAYFPIIEVYDEEDNALRHLFGVKYGRAVGY